MTYTVNAPDLSHAWIAAMEQLFITSGKAVNLIVSFQECETETVAIRNLVDHFLHEQHIPPINEVANTIFPQSLYLPHLGDEAREHLYTQYRMAYEGVIHRYRGNGRGTYFYRLINWMNGQSTKSAINQLEYLVRKLRTELRRQQSPGPKSSMYELGLSETNGIPAEPHLFSEDLRIQDPARDHSIQMGFPCLSHISLTFADDRLHMTALYRNQTFVTKAYGNYLGLARLLRFICLEAGCLPGEITCIASHADGEFTIGKRRLQLLIEECRALAVFGGAV